MEKKIMIAIGVVAVIIVAAIGAALVLNNNSSSNSNVKILKLSEGTDATAYSPLDKEAVYNGSYPLSRYLYLYTDGVPAADSSIGKWLAYIYSDDGQQKVSDAGFYPLADAEMQDMEAQLAAPTADAKNINGGFTESGSTTLGELTLLWSTEFEGKTGIHVTIDQVGSGTGIERFINGLAEVAQASRAMKSSEITTAEGKGIDVVEWKVAVDGIALIVHGDNPVEELSMELKGLFSGTITNWNQVGGNDQPVALYGREESSGTYATFEELVLGTGVTYDDKMLKMPTNAAILPEVEHNAGGIGYVGIGYAMEAAGIDSTADVISFDLAIAREL